MTGDLFVWLFEATLATTAAMLVVLAARRPLRAAAGACAAYLLWAAVPLVAVAVLLPAAVLPIPEIRLSLPAAVGGAPIASAVGTARDTTGLLLLAWFAGALATVAWLARNQRRFVGTLGELRMRPDGLLQSDACAGLPAVLGWRNRIVLPADFDARYDAHERELVLCHERVHQRRGDLPAAAVAAVMRCLFWFNPVVHVAASRFRDDQELACDAAVLRRHPASRRRYGDALLKTQLAAQPLPVGCHWFGSHPLKERIAMLKRPVPSSSRRVAGLLLSLAAVCGGATLAWAAQPGAPVPAGRIGLEMDVKIDGGAPRTLSGVLTPGVPHAFEFDAGDEHWRIDATVLATKDGGFDLAAKIARDGDVVGEPRLLFNDSGAAIGIGDELPDGSFDGIAIELRAVAGTGAADGVASDLAAGLAAPAYPPEALERGEGGVVVLELRVGTNGRVLSSSYVADGSTVPESSPLVQASRDAAARWEIAPAMKDGKPIEASVRVPVTFEPEKG
jgi:TonB family protein